jgi:hypothetical protein
VEDAPKSGRPIKATNKVKGQVVQVLKKNSTTRQLSTLAISQIVAKIGTVISARTVWNILNSLGYSPCKPTTKPGLTTEAKALRLKWCLEHAHWTLEDWKNVIWSDETSVTMGSQRGRIRVWRLSSEAYQHHCVRHRWKGFKEFMFWGCFSYDKKGPCHIWEEETKKEKKEADKWLNVRNEEFEPIKKLEWELTTGMRRLRATRNNPGKKPTWKWNKDNGKLERNSKGGIDWYRYHRVILEKKLIPFAKECQKDRPKTIIQDDNASAHRHWYHEHMFDIWKVEKLLWPPNSPDLNAIEPPWFYMKKETTKHGKATSQAQLKEDWEACWEAIEQVKIQAWIERIPRHIQEVISLEGGNEYKEGRTGGKGRKKNPDRIRL